MSFTVCTYNMGSTENDYLKACQSQDFTFVPDENFTEKYNELEKKTADILVNNENLADVYCLQEVGEENRPLINSLKAKGYTIIHCQGLYFDEAIALKTTRFKAIKDCSTVIDRKSVPIATATDAETGLQVAFSSVHLFGFNLNGRLQIEERAIQDGNSFCKNLILKLNAISNCALQVIGVDMNANPEVMDAILEADTKQSKRDWKVSDPLKQTLVENNRFKALEKAGFKINRTNKPTNLNSVDAFLKCREIDFIYARTMVKKSFWQELTSIFFQTIIGLTSAIKDSNPLAGDQDRWDLQKNASDHAPVFANISSIIEESKLTKVYQAISGMFSCIGQLFKYRKPATTSS